MNVTRAEEMAVEGCQQSWVELRGRDRASLPATAKG
jgi:hypothetical protein